MKKAKILKIIGVVLLVVFILLQFIPAELNTSEEYQAVDISNLYNVPNEVYSRLQTSCYDCHSSNTEYPWYDKIQPVAMYLEEHVKDGKKHLNFSEFGNYTIKRQKKKLDEVVHEKEDGKMPLTSYTLIHNNVKLFGAEKETIFKWA